MSGRIFDPNISKTKLIEGVSYGITGGLAVLGPVSRKSRKLFGPEKPFVKLRPAYSVKLVFSYVVKGIKIKNNFKVSCLESP